MKLYVWYSQKWDQVFLADSTGTRIIPLDPGGYYFTRHGKLPETYVYIGEL